MRKWDAHLFKNSGMCLACEAGYTPTASEYINGRLVFYDEYDDFSMEEGHTWCNLLMDGELTNPCNKHNVGLHIGSVDENEDDYSEESMP